MSVEDVKWLLAAIIIVLGCPLGLLIRELSWPKAFGVIAVVHLMGVLFYLMGSL